MPEQATPLASIVEALVTNLVAAVKPQITDLHGQSWEEIEAAIRTRAVGLREGNAARAIDGPSQQWLLVSSLVLAVYQELRPLVDDTQVLLSTLRDAMAAPFKERLTAYIADRFAITQDAPEEAFRRITENFKTRGEERMGSTILYVQDVQDAERSFTNIHRCFYNDFFRANGAPEVTPIFCAMDYLWAEELEKPQYGVRFERPTTLARGDDMCRFQFTKITTRP